jgi:hypothetical protein
MHSSFCCLYLILFRIATSYGLDDRGVGVRVQVGARIFTSPCCPERLWGPPSLLSNGYRGLFPGGVKRPGREAGPSPPTGAEVEKTCFYLPYHIIPYMQIFFYILWLTYKYMATSISAHFLFSGMLRAIIIFMAPDFIKLAKSHLLGNAIGNKSGVILKKLCLCSTN